MNANGGHTPCFYEHSDYVPLVNKNLRRDIHSEYVHISRESKPLLGILSEYRNKPVVERAGILPGEYVLYGGSLLIGRDGSVFIATMAREDPYIRLVDRYCAEPAFPELKKTVLEHWDKMPVLQDTPIIIHPFGDNYFHWTCETIPKIRFFVNHRTKRIFMNRWHLTSLFQKDLFALTASGKTATYIEAAAIRMVNPLVSHEFMSEDGMRWLKKTVNVPVQSGNRRIYLRRPPGGTRTPPGGGISETPEFLAFLKEYGFEIVDVGSQERRIHEQVALLDGASVILAPHGAALTNLAYLHAPLSVIEVMGTARQGAFYMHIASMFRFRYYGIYTTACDAQNDLQVDVEELRDIMRTMGARPQVSSIRPALVPALQE